MRLIDRVGGLAGTGAAIYILFLPGCICDLWIPRTQANLEPGAPSGVIAKAFAANRDSHRVGAFIGLIAVFLLIIFFSRLYGALKDVSKPGSWLPIMVLASGVLMAGSLLFEIGLGFSASELSFASRGSNLYEQETVVARIFLIWGWNSAHLLAPPFALALAGTTFTAWSASAFPKWYRWASVALLVPLLLISVVMRAPGLGIAPGMVWMFLTSFVLAIRPKARAAEPAR